MKYNKISFKWKKMGLYGLFITLTIILIINSWTVYAETITLTTWPTNEQNVQALIDAINDANEDDNHDTIILPSCTYILTQVNTTEYGATGLPSITTPINIIGAGEDKTIIERQNEAPSFRIFQIAESGNLTLNGLSVRGGKDFGGIFNLGITTLANTTITKNQSSYGSFPYSGGGGIRNRGEMIVMDSTISENEGWFKGGGIYNYGNMSLTNTTISSNFGGEDGGGGIYNTGDMILTNTKIYENFCGMDGGGGGIFNNFGHMILRDTTIEGNTSDGAGGGVSNYSSMELFNTNITNNQAWGNRSSPTSDFYEGGGGIYNRGTTSIMESSISENDCKYGGGICNTGIMNIIESTISENDGDDGGGIYNGGYGGYMIRDSEIVLTNTIISKNKAALTGGGLYNYENGKVEINSSIIDNNEASTGAGIYNEGEELTIIDTTISSNATMGSSHGGGIRNLSEMTIKNTTINGNYGDHGGGIMNDDSGVILITNTTISNNSTSGIFNMGRTSIMDSTISKNGAGFKGGGIFNMNYMEITNTTISMNDGGEDGGGGIYNDSNMILTNTTIYKNSCGMDAGGGGIWNNLGHMILRDTTIEGNTSEGSGGGILNYSSMELFNTTIINNHAYSSLYIPEAVSQGGGGIWSGGTMNIMGSTISENDGAQGGGIYNTGEIVLTNTTISENKAAVGSGGGIYNNESGEIRIRNTIIASNPEGGDCSGSITSLGHNLDSDCSCDLTEPSDIPCVENPLLGPLQNNGGPTQTHALLPNSPAIDAGDIDDCSATDQRGVRRPQDGDGNGEAICDIGAYEKLPTVEILSDNTWKSWSELHPDLPDWETLDFDDSGWRNACAPYPYHEDYPPSYWIPSTNAVYMWDHTDCMSATGLNGPDETWFRKTFNIPLNYIITNASAVVAADDDFDFYVNGSKVYSDWDGVVGDAPYSIDIKPYLVSGENIFAMYANDSYGIWEWTLVDTTIEMLNLDFDNNGCVDRDDLSIILAYIRGPGPHYDLSFDLNGDGEVNIADARKLITYFTNPKGTPCF